MPVPGSLMAMVAMMEEEDPTCARCKKPLRDYGEFEVGGNGVSFYCDRPWCRFMRWLKSGSGQAEDGGEG